MATASAQNAYDAEKLLGNDLNGTARFVGMGGAMGALGGDISSVNTNPAGLGVNIASDLSLSLSTYSNKNTSTLGSSAASNKVNKTDLGNTRNLIISSLILTFGIGGAVFQFGEFTIAGIGLASLIGVILNLVLTNHTKVANE